MLAIVDHRQLKWIIAGTLSLACRSSALSGPKTYNVLSYGAKGDRQTLDNGAIDRAIQAASAAGGGTVWFPAGNYLSTTVHLKSNITLYFGSGATLIAATPTETVRYDAHETNPWDQFQDFGHSHWRNGLIVGEGLENVAILGHGQIWGRGLERDISNVPASGDKSISLKLCKNVTIRDVSFRHAGWFAILATGVDNLTIDNLRIDTNRDGMDIDCCRQVHITNCTVNSPTDDGICLKSSFALGVNRATEDVTISNCHVSGFKEGTLLEGTFEVLPGNPTGRIKCGTESNGGFKNVAISNCVFDHCRGLNLSTVDGGALEDISIDNVVMRDIGNSPIFMRLGARLRAPAGTKPGTFQRVSISHLTVYNSAAPSLIVGMSGHPIEDVSLTDVRIYPRGGGTEKQALTAPPEFEDGYPAPEAFGPLPASGLFIRHVKGIDLTHLTIKPEKEDRRPPFVLVDVDDADLFRITAPRPPTVPLVTFTDTQGLRIHSADGTHDTVKPVRSSGRL